VIPVEFRGDLWLQKTRVHVLSYGFVFDPVFSRFSRTPTCDTDRHRSMASTADA